MSHCAYCQANATVIITGRGTSPASYRSATTCDTHRDLARTWAARAGPPHETTIGDEQELNPTLF